MGSGDGSSDPSQKVDKTLQTYRQRLGQDQEHTRKDIERLRKELVELIELRYDMAISHAELPPADMALQSIQATGVGAAGAVTEGGQTDERQAARADALHRELLSVVQTLNSDVGQARNGIEQLASQLRTPEGATTAGATTPGAAEETTGRAE